jgi:hypothetical protein
MAFAILASNGKFYTGRAGTGWLGEKAEAFAYGLEGAEAKAALFNKLNGPLCGLTFSVAELPEHGSDKYRPGEIVCPA